MADAAHRVRYIEEGSGQVFYAQLDPDHYAEGAFVVCEVIPLPKSDTYEFVVLSHGHDSAVKALKAADSFHDVQVAVLKIYSPTNDPEWVQFHPNPEGFGTIGEDRDLDNSGFVVSRVVLKGDSDPHRLINLRYGYDSTAEAWANAASVAESEKVSPDEIVVTRIFHSVSPTWKVSRFTGGPGVAEFITRFSTFEEADLFLRNMQIKPMTDED
ncbi:MAG: hypothetical protein MK358_07600 [Vicinamibacterales bacterium]|nr:hypothetical protein [Vicinamibacterales bacterium]|tara:strand:- start:2055 stop:2693 length:639 start_codon:yes stop_codon:yes gene_type:complete